MPLVALCPRHFLADSIIWMCVFDVRQAQAERKLTGSRVLRKAAHLTRTDQLGSEFGNLMFVVHFEASFLDDDVPALDVAKRGKPFPKRLHERGPGCAGCHA